MRLPNKADPKENIQNTASNHSIGLLIRAKMFLPKSLLDIHNTENNSAISSPSRILSYTVQ